MTLPCFRHALRERAKRAGKWNVYFCVREKAPRVGGACSSPGKKRLRELSVFPVFIARASLRRRNVKRAAANISSNLKCPTEKASSMLPPKSGNFRCRRISSVPVRRERIFPRSTANATKPFTRAGRNPLPPPLRQPDFIFPMRFWKNFAGTARGCSILRFTSVSERFSR